MSDGLSVEGLSAGYGPLRVLHSIDLEVAPGERIGLVGLNGHGKSTLLRALVGLVDWRHGKIELKGRSILDVPTHELARRGVVLIPQGDAIFPGLSVRENLDAGAIFPSRAWRQRTLLRQRVLDLFPQLTMRLDQRAGTLSGGERRMVSVGRGLMTTATVYLIDEPSLGLAPGLSRDLLDTLTSLDVGNGILVVAEQNRALVENKLDRVVAIHHGKVVEGKPAANLVGHRGAGEA